MTDRESFTQFKLAKAMTNPTMLPLPPFGVEMPHGTSAPEKGAPFPGLHLKEGHHISAQVSEKSIFRTDM